MSVLLGSAFLAAVVCVMFTPRELSYDADRFFCRLLVQGTHTYRWDQLEAYGGSDTNVFLLKFTGHQALQISSFGFRRREWQEFRQFLKRTYPQKRCWFWLGPKPQMRKR